ncbi:Glutamate receptor 2.2 [Abeliophyllum distichum]|uniref:Glutamate receptor 2.2 n=1 Tax=Abeliophyllum distichum TaxID=126358 RepID=A0ABD1ULF7_9LAMI
MQEVLGVNPHVPKRKRLRDFTVRWNSEHQHETESNIFGLWAYDAATALARVSERVGTKNFSLQKSENLIQVLSTIRFRGLSGEFHIFNGQVQSSAFQLVNVFGEGEREIGFWTPENEFLMRLINVKNMTRYNVSKDNLNLIRPGEITSVPKGWEIPTNGKRLSIGLPSKTFFPEFVEVTRDSSKNVATVKGYCIDVLMQTNAVVGDVMILANISSYVDFTLPYASNGSVPGLFDEIPFLNLFQAQYCSKYTVVEPTYKADGFGFVFPMGSPLVSDVSGAILKVTEGEKMRQIENKCFWGLFVVVGVASILALIVSSGLFLYEQRSRLINYFLNRSQRAATNDVDNNDNQESNSFADLVLLLAIFFHACRHPLMSIFNRSSTVDPRLLSSSSNTNDWPGRSNTTEGDIIEINVDQPQPPGSQP